MKGFSIIVAACARSYGIGKYGTLPWKIHGDMNHFKDITTSLVGENPSAMNVVIMGRKTYESIPANFRPLKNRINVILSHNANLREELTLHSDVIVATSLRHAMELVNGREKLSSIGNIFIIGGGSLYAEAIKSSFCRKIYFTEVYPTQLNDPRFEGFDTFFPAISAFEYKLTSKSGMETENDISYRFLEFDRIDDDDHAEDKLSSFHEEKTSESLQTPITTQLKPNTTPNVEEMQYLDIIRDILANGTVKGDRTGTGTISKFGVQMRFSLQNNQFPLLTTKKVFWRGVAEELLWFIQGSTNANILKAKGIHIWDGNGSREFLDKLGFIDRDEGDLGPVYGFQWRHFGAEYKDMHTDYTNQGIDQLRDCIAKIRSNPNDRRIILTAWNPLDVNKMALPPCHMFCQFYVANNELSCQMYQRSADMGLGVPFNIASYSLLTVMIAHVCGLKPGDFIHSIGDAHIYMNHVDALKEQLLREPRPFPTIRLNRVVDDIDGFRYEDFSIDDYNPHATIAMKMAV